jgi:hypothetical protein
MTDRNPIALIPSPRTRRLVWRPFLYCPRRRQVHLLLQQRALGRKHQGGQLQCSRYRLCARVGGTAGSAGEGGYVYTHMQASGRNKMLTRMRLQCAKCPSLFPRSRTSRATLLSVSAHTGTRLRAQTRGSSGGASSSLLC